MLWIQANSAVYPFWKGSSAATTKRRTLPSAITGSVITTAQNPSTCTVHRLAIAMVMSACENKTSAGGMGKTNPDPVIPIIPEEFR